MTQQQLQIIEDYFARRPYYYTDGKGHFFANPSHRKAKDLHYVGRFPNAKKAREMWEYRQATADASTCPDIDDDPAVDLLLVKVKQFGKPA